MKLESFISLLICYKTPQIHYHTNGMMKTVLMLHKNTSNSKLLVYVFSVIKKQFGFNSKIICFNKQDMICMC